MEEVLTIEKELIPTLYFPSEDVLVLESDKTEREFQFRAANKLALLRKQGVEIVFRDDLHIMKVHTTICGFNKDVLFLKGKTSLPIKRVQCISIS